LITLDLILKHVLYKLI